MHRFCADPVPLTAGPWPAGTSGTARPCSLSPRRAPPAAARRRNSMDSRNDEWQVPAPGAGQRSTVARVGRPAALVAGGLITGAVLAGTLTAGAATLTGNGNSGGGGTAVSQYGDPGVQENDGIPESQ